MVRTKFSARKTGGKKLSEAEPPLKSVKVSAETESEASKSVPVDEIAIVLDTEKMQQATKMLPKIPKLVKKEPAEKSEELTLPNPDNLNKVS